ncbi:hypothetical protein HIM_01759 [Hirsutella minnesotensis 3608]|nr:hypothetical protein HIM_01759 [Hirsutella minnesotensis 3608]
MATHHEPLKALGRVDWDDVPGHGLADFLGQVFSEAQTVIDSIPSSTPTWVPAKPGPSPLGRARAKTEPAAMPLDMSQAAPVVAESSPAAAAAKLRDEWKEVKVSPRDNPLGIRVYKLAGKDGQGSWFARRSVHDRLSFDRWRASMQREFPETMKVQGSPGSGNIRGIGADKRVEHQDVTGAGQLSVFQLSAQFPGPTAPRDFVTLLLSCDSSAKGSDPADPLRQHMVVSKPCVHPECPPRQGIIRGQYESVEVIREIPTEGFANKRSLSDVDLASNEKRRDSAAKPSDEAPRAVEWLMVTRSDPGGSVPRFMIDKGTPPGIVGDAGKFLDWAASSTAEESASPKDGESPKDEAPKVSEEQPSASREPRGTESAGNRRGNSIEREEDPVPSSNGLYGIIAGAFGVASTVASGIRQQFGPALGATGSSDATPAAGSSPQREDDSDSDTDSDSSSTRSFASAMEKSMTREKALGSIGDSISDESHSQMKTPEDKQLQKLIERRRKLEEDYSKMQERLQSKRLGEKEKDVAAQTKAREKHERELAKQEAKYKREMKKIEEKREHEERKAEQRRRKTLEKEEKASLAAELERVKADRDVALKKVELLQEQVGELQSQNTMLVAKLGRTGSTSRVNSTSSRELSIKGSPQP